MPPAALRSSITIATLFILVLGAAFLAFWPGLGGPFVFDDTPNLKHLSKNGGVTDFNSFLEFVFHGGRLPGRSLTYLSFLLNDVSWPSKPWPFKYTNLLIHLLNGILVFVLTRQLTRHFPAKRPNADYLALAIFAIWLLHPIHLSTMMLVIQRLVELMSLFVLLGLIAYIKGRLIVNERPFSGYLWMSAGVGICGVLAVLSKENGILLSLYVAVLEYTLIRHKIHLPVPRYWRYWATIFIVVPLTFLVAYVAARWEHSLVIYDTRRTFTPLERLITEPRILFDYLFRILTLRVRGSGIYHDDYPFSTGLLSPPSTLFAILGVGLSLLFSLNPRFRRRFPMVAFAILWFLAGHTIESTILHLELYFEHRNYLPMLGPLMAIIMGILSVQGQVKPIAITALIIFLGLQTLLSWQSARIWGDRATLAKVLVNENPGSLRARQQAASYWFHRGRTERTIHHLEAAIAANPDAIDLRLQVIYTECLTGRLSRDSLPPIMQRLQEAPFSFATISTINTLRKKSVISRCDPLTLDILQEMLDQLLQNPSYSRYPPHRSTLYYIKAKISREQRLLNPAMHYLEQAYKAAPSTDIALLQCHWLLEAGLPKEAQKYLDRARATRSELGYKGWFKPSKQEHFELLQKRIDGYRRKRHTKQLQPPNKTAIAPQ